MELAEKLQYIAKYQQLISHWVKSSFESEMTM